MLNIIRSVFTTAVPITTDSSGSASTSADLIASSSGSTSRPRAPPPPSQLAHAIPRNTTIADAFCSLKAFESAFTPNGRGCVKRRYEETCIKVAKATRRPAVLTEHAKRQRLGEDQQRSAAEAEEEERSRGADEEALWQEEEELREHLMEKFLVDLQPTPGGVIRIAAAHSVACFHPIKREAFNIEDGTDYRVDLRLEHRAEATIDRTSWIFQFIGPHKAPPFSKMSFLYRVDAASRLFETCQGIDSPFFAHPEAFGILESSSAAKQKRGFLMYTLPEELLLDHLRNVLEAEGALLRAGHARGFLMDAEAEQRVSELVSVLRAISAAGLDYRDLTYSDIRVAREDNGKVISIKLSPCVIGSNSERFEITPASLAPGVEDHLTQLFYSCLIPYYELDHQYPRAAGSFAQRALEAVLARLSTSYKPPDLITRTKGVWTPVAALSPVGYPHWPRDYPPDANSRRRNPVDRINSVVASAQGALAGPAAKEPSNKENERVDAGPRATPRPATPSLSLPHQAIGEASSTPSSPLFYLRTLFATSPVIQSTPVTSPSRRLIAPLPRSRLSAAAQVSLARSSSATAPHPTILASACLSPTASPVVSEGAERPKGKTNAERAVEGVKASATSGEIAEEQQGADVKMLVVEREEVQKEERLSGSAPASEAIEAHEAKEVGTALSTTPTVNDQLHSQPCAPSSSSVEKAASASFDTTDSSDLPQLSPTELLQNRPSAPPLPAAEGSETADTSGTDVSKIVQGEEGHQDGRRKRTRVSAEHEDLEGRGRKTGQSASSKVAIASHEDQVRPASPRPRPLDTTSAAVSAPLPNGCSTLQDAPSASPTASRADHIPAPRLTTAPPTSRALAKAAARLIAALPARAVRDATLNATVTSISHQPASSSATPTRPAGFESEAARHFGRRILESWDDLESEFELMMPKIRQMMEDPIFNSLSTHDCLLILRTVLAGMEDRRDHLPEVCEVLKLKIRFFEIEAAERDWPDKKRSRRESRTRDSSSASPRPPTQSNKSPHLSSSRLALDAASSSPRPRRASQQDQQPSRSRLSSPSVSRPRMLNPEPIVATAEGEGYAIDSREPRSRATAAASGDGQEVDDEEEQEERSDEDDAEGAEHLQALAELIASRGPSRDAGDDNAKAGPSGARRPSSPSYSRPPPRLLGSSGQHSALLPIPRPSATYSDLESNEGSDGRPSTDSGERSDKESEGGASEEEGEEEGVEEEEEEQEEEEDEDEDEDEGTVCSQRSEEDDSADEEVLDDDGDIIVPGPHHYRLRPGQAGGLLAHLEDGISVYTRAELNFARKAIQRQSRQHLHDLAKGSVIGKVYQEKEGRLLVKCSCRRCQHWIPARSRSSYSLPEFRRHASRPLQGHNLSMGAVVDCRTPRN